MKFPRTPRSTWKVAAVAAAVSLGAGTIVATGTIGAQTADISESDAEVFVSVSPERFLDTRTGVGADDTDPFGPQETRTLQIAGLNGIPDSATSVAINTTIPALPGDPTSFFTVWPSGDTRPDTSANNSQPLVDVPNFSLFQLGNGGALDIYNDRFENHFVVDVVGYFVPLSEVADGGLPGGDLLSGSGEPDDDDGSNGDAYVDTDTGQLYVKANDEFVSTATPTVASDSAIGARNDGDLAGVGPDDDDNGDAADFNTTDVEFGSSIEKTDIDTFTFLDAGFYEVTYRVSSDAGALTFGAQLAVDGDSVGGENVLAAGGGQLTDTVLVEADSGDSLELVLDDIAQLNGNRSISIELIAVT